MSEKILERVVETPAIALDKTITATKQVTQNIPINKSIKVNTLIGKIIFNIIWPSKIVINSLDLF